MKYGYPEKVQEDIKTLNAILARQGTSLLIDVLAENAGRTANKFNLNSDERLAIYIKTSDELKESLMERL